MEDDYKITLKGKIKILYQLEKLQDVVKLAEQYNEKYGKDVEIDMMRFKSERRLGRATPAEANKAHVAHPENQAQKNSESVDIPGTGDEEEPLLLLPEDHEVMQSPAVLVVNEIPAFDQPLLKEKLVDEPFSAENELIITDPFAEDKPVFSQEPDEPSPDANELIISDPFAEDKPVFGQEPDEPSPDANELIITDPFAEDKPVFGQEPDEPSTEASELVISDPFAENKPGFSLAHNEPPVILIDSGKVENAPIQTEPRAEEMSIVEESPNEFVNTRITFDYKSNPAMAFDAEPSLAPALQGEELSIQINDEEKKLPAESLPPNPPVEAESAEALNKTSVSAAKEMALEPKIESVAFPVDEQVKTLAAESFTETAAEKHQLVSDPYNNFIKKPKSPKKIAFNLKYFLILMLPLAAAVFLWLALSGKLNFDGGAVENVTPISVVKPQVPVVQKLTPKITPEVQIPPTDDKEQLVNEKIIQANIFIENNDILNALAVVLEAKKIKMTEPLRLLEERITKKIQEDEALAVKEKQTAQSVVQSEDQDYNKAETENTLAAWRNFLLQYPQSEFAGQVRNKIIVLEKEAVKKAEQELQLKIQQMQKLRLRSDYMNLSQTELTSTLQQLGKLPVQFEQLEHGGAKVIIDFSSGLMWILWNKPMGFEKAKWWANRIYAGYAGWRLPTVEESLSLLQMNPALYAGLTDFAIWTGDMVSDKSHSIWALKIPQGQFVPEDFNQTFYVWAVRKAGK